MQLVWILQDIEDENKVTGLQLQTARTEINNKQKKRKYFLFFLKSNTILREERRGNYVVENLHNISLYPLRVFSSPN